MKYSYEDNFIGCKIAGYHKNIAYLKKEAAHQLILAQKELKNLNMSFIIYDAYRPQKASEQFYLWCMDENDQKKKLEYYPNVNKKNLYDCGYIARKSSHTRGIAVDVSIYDFNKKCVLDMGSPFDLFDEKSHTMSKEISKAQLNNRLFLKRIMESVGFENLSTEWWHYALNNPNKYPDFYDFDVE